MVPGVRRVWGTFKHTPAGAVAATLKKLTTTGDRLTIKRVFRRGTAEGRDRWWFHLLGEEELLKQLEGEWESVSLQTCWKLEPCSKPARSEKSTEHTNLNPTELEATAPGPEHSIDPAAAPSIETPRVEQLHYPVQTFLIQSLLLVQRTMVSLSLIPRTQTQPMKVIIFYWWRGRIRPKATDL